MKTKLSTAHEEKFSNSEKVFGVLINYSIDDNWKESFIYIYNDNIYIFFNTIIDMMDYFLYGEKKMKRAYMEENYFDNYYDSEYIDGTFNSILEWTN